MKNMINLNLMEVEPIIDSDIIYKDELVCIINPDVKKGILVFTQFVQPQNEKSLYETGLMTGAEMRAKNIDFLKRIYHPYIFFRAPYYSRDIDYTTIQSEIESLYGESLQLESKIFIRVDPNQTFVFSSEIRTRYVPKINFDTPKYHELIDFELRKSKKTLSEYLIQIKKNFEIKKDFDHNYVNNLYTSQLIKLPKYFIGHKYPYPYDDTPIERNSEILVSIPHMGPEYFVKCLWNILLHV